METKSWPMEEVGVDWGEGGRGAVLRGVLRLAGDSQSGWGAAEAAPSCPNSGAAVGTTVAGGNKNKSAAGGLAQCAAYMWGHLDDPLSKGSH